MHWFKALKDLDMVDILVAPYESDAQLAFLTKTNKAYAVITEDSDLIPFGCERVRFMLYFFERLFIVLPFNCYVCFNFCFLNKCLFYQLVIYGK